MVAGRGEVEILDERLARIAGGQSPAVRRLFTTSDAVKVIGLTFGWDDVTGFWRPIRVDTSGAFQFVPAGLAVGQVFVGTLAVSTSLTQLLSSESTRRFLFLKNVSSDLVYITMSPTADEATAYPLSPGEGVNLEGYTGAVYGWSVAVASKVAFLRATGT